MGFFDQLKDKTSQLTDKVGATFNDAKNQLGDYRAQAAEAKLPVEGSLARYPEKADKEEQSDIVWLKHYARQLYLQTRA